VDKRRSITTAGIADIALCNKVLAVANNKTKQVSIYSLDTDQLIQTSSLLGTPKYVLDNYGCCVAVSSDYVIVGSSTSSEYKPKAGKVSVHKIRQGLPSVSRTLIPEDIHTGSGFGKAVAVYGSVLVVLCSTDSVNGNDINGCVYLYNLDNLNKEPLVFSAPTITPDTVFTDSLAINNGMIFVCGKDGLDTNSKHELYSLGYTDNAITYRGVATNDITNVTPHSARVEVFDHILLYTTSVRDEDVVINTIHVYEYDGSDYAPVNEIRTKGIHVNNIDIAGVVCDGNYLCELYTPTKEMKPLNSLVTIFNMATTTWESINPSN